MNHTHTKAKKNWKHWKTALNCKKEVYPPGDIYVENREVLWHLPDFCVMV